MGLDIVRVHGSIGGDGIKEGGGGWSKEEGKGGAWIDQRKQKSQETIMKWCQTNLNCFEAIQGGNWFAMVHQALWGGERRLHTNIKSNLPIPSWLYNDCNYGFHPPQRQKSMHLVMARLGAKLSKVQVLDPTIVEPSWAHRIDPAIYVNWLWMWQVLNLLT